MLRSLTFSRASAVGGTISRRLLNFPSYSRSTAFHSSIPALVKVGDQLPDLEVLAENSPGNKVNLRKELQGKGVIVGVPAAFSEFSLNNLPVILGKAGMYVPNCPRSQARTEKIEYR